MSEKKKKMKATQVDLLTLPGISHYANTFRQTLFANYAVLNESKEIFFQELALSAKAGVPLTEALSIAQARHKDLGVAKAAHQTEATGPVIRITKLLLIVYLVPIALAVILFGLPVFLLLFAIVATRLPAFEKISRTLANLVLDDVTRGVELSDAMGKHLSCFEKWEIEMVRYGEKSGTLIETLERLASIHARQNQFLATRLHSIYPLILTAMIIPGIVFLSTSIFPKYRDIYTQLGAELPSLTASIFSLDLASVSLILSLLITFLIGQLIFLRLFMNGTILGKVISTSIILPYAFFIILIPALAVTEFYLRSLAGVTQTEEDQWRFGVSLACLFLTTVMLPYLCKAFDVQIRHLERLTMRLFGMLPLRLLSGNSYKDNLILETVGVVLGSGAELSRALETSSYVINGAVDSKTQKTVKLVEGGVPFHVACRKSRLLSAATCSNLAMIDRGHGYRQGLQRVANSVREKSEHYAERAGTVIESMYVILVGVMMLFLIIAIYLPLFSIPRIIP